MNNQEIRSVIHPSSSHSPDIQEIEKTVQEEIPVITQQSSYCPLSTDKGRLLKRFFDLGLTDAEGNPNRNFNFPPLPSLDEEYLDPVTSLLSNGIVIKEKSDNKKKPPTVYQTNKKLGLFLNLQRQFKGSQQQQVITRTHLVGGKAKASFPEKWHVKAAESLKVLGEEEISLLKKILNRPSHKPRDTDIRLYAPAISREEYRFIGNYQVDFLTHALCEVKKIPKNFASKASFKEKCLDNFCLYPHEGNLFSIIGFGQDTEILIVNKLRKASLWKHSSLEIPLDEPLENLGREHENPTSIQPACFTFKDGELKERPIYEQWASVFSEWFQILNTKKIKKLNFAGWPSSIVNQVKGYTIKSPTLSDRIYDQMVDSFITEKNPIQEITDLLNKATENHLGTDRAHFIAVAWTACLRLKGKFSEKDIRLLWKGMMKRASEFKQKENLLPFFSVLEKAINSRPSIPLEHIEDLIVLSGLLNLSCTHSELAPSFCLENHLGTPMIQMKIQNFYFNLPFDPLGCLQRISSRISLMNAQLTELCHLMPRPQVFEDLSPLEIERPFLSLNFEEWKPYARSFLDTVHLKKFGLDLLNLIFVFNPTDEGAYIFLNEVQTLLMEEGTEDRLEQIFQTFKKASQLNPQTSYLSDSVIFLETILQENSREKKLTLFIRQSIHSPSVFLKNLSSSFTDTHQVSLEYTNMLINEGALPEALKMMKRLQSKSSNREFNKEWPLFIHILEKSKESDSTQLRKLGKLALNLVQFAQEKDNLSPLHNLIRDLWKDPSTLDLGFDLLKNLLLKNPSLQENIWLEGCEKSLESDKGISLAFELWNMGSSLVSKKDKERYDKFCFSLFEKLGQYKNSEISHFLQDTKKEVGDSSSQNILLKLKTIELDHLLTEKDWETALKLIQTIVDRGKVTELESSDTFVLLLEKCLKEVPLTEHFLSKILSLFTSRSITEVLEGHMPDFFSLLSLSLKRLEEENPQSRHLKPLLNLVLNRINTSEDFSGSASLTLKLLLAETFEIEKNLGKWELLLSHFLKTQQAYSFGLLVVLLHRYNQSCPKSILKEADECLKELATQNPKLGFEVFNLVFERLKNPLPILQALIESPHTFNFSLFFKKLKLNSKSFTLLRSSLVKMKDFQNHYHLLVSYSNSCSHWKELLKELDSDSLLYKKTNLFVLKFSSHTDETAPDHILHALEESQDKEMVQLALECTIKHKIASLAVWRRLIGVYQTYSTFKGQLHLPSTFLFQILLEKGFPALWILFLETSLNLSNKHWLSLMKELPRLEDHFGDLNQSKREVLYTNLLTRALSIMSKVEDEKVQCQMIRLRSHLKSLSPQNFTRQDFNFLADSIERGGVEYFASTMEEIREAFPTFLNGELSKLYSLIFPAVCLKFYELKSKKERLNREIDAFILLIFVKGLKEQRLDVNQFNYELPLLARSLSSQYLVDLAKNVLHAKDQKKLSASIQKHKKLIQKRLLEVRTSEALDFALDFSDETSTSTSLAVEIFQQAASFPSLDLKEKALHYFCDVYYSEKNKIPGSIESSLAALLASIPNDSTGSWPIFLSMCTKVFGTINPGVWDGTLIKQHPCPISYVGLNLYFGQIDPIKYNLIGKEPQEITHDSNNLMRHIFAKERLKKDWEDFANTRELNKPTQINCPNFHPLLLKVVEEITRRLLKFARREDNALNSSCVLAALEFNTAEIIELYTHSSLPTKIIDPIYNSFAFELSFYKTPESQIHSSLVERLMDALRSKNTLRREDAKLAFSKALHLNTDAPLTYFNTKLNPDTLKETILELIYEQKNPEAIRRAIQIFCKDSEILKKNDFKNLFRNIISEGMSYRELWTEIQTFIFRIMLRREDGLELFKLFFSKACTICKELEGGKSFLQETLKKSLEEKILLPSNPLYKELLLKTHEKN